MADQSNEHSQTALGLIGEVSELTRRLARKLSELRGVNETIAREITADVKSEIDKNLDTANSWETRSNTLPTKRLSVEQSDPLSDINLADFEVSNVNKEGVRSYYKPSDFSQQKSKHRNWRAKMVDNVVIGLIFANKGRSPPITFQDISDELIRISLTEDRNTTYGRISRLRKDGIIAEIDPEYRNSYFLTNTGYAYFAKKLKEGKLL